MPTYTLTLLDTIGIQDYIFGSNVLRENIGASELVRRATRLWPFEQVRQADKTNVKSGTLSGDPEDMDDRLHIEDGDLAAEVIYAGGGNCAVLFADSDKARDFVTSLSRQVLEEAPELELVAVHMEVDWDNHALADKVGEALDRLAAKKLQRRVSTPLLGVSTTVACRSTGLPAVGTDADEPDLKPLEETPRPLSAGILAKLRYLKKANQYLERLLPYIKEAGLHIPHDFDNFGRQAGEISYIAVVHADGNGMADRIEGLRREFATPKDNRAYTQAMRDFSRVVESASRQALGELSTTLLRHWRPREGVIVGAVHDGQGELISLEDKAISLTEKEARRYIPFRPIVFGGDDLTFVSDGRLGLTLAAAYLDAFEKAMSAQDNRHTQDLRACAGIAVVKAHYPFSRAYDLADGLCCNAKKAWERRVSALDWHFAATGLFGDIHAIRERQYIVPAGHLEMRPAPLRDGADLWRSWPGFAHATGELLMSEAWKDKRNKVIALRQALRDGPEAVTRFRTAYSLKELPMLAPGIESLQTTGWDGAGRCGYFDAIEALDFFLPLEG
jgi:hypothetical protein